MLAQFSVASWNVRGIREEKKRKVIFSYLREQKADINFLQEIHSSVHNEQIWKNQWGGEMFFDHGTQHSSGLAILISSKLQFQTLNLYQSKVGRCLMLRIKVEDAQFLLVNI